MLLLMLLLLLLQHPPVSRECIKLSKASRILREVEPVVVGGAGVDLARAVDEGRVGGVRDGDHVGLPHVAVPVRLLRPVVAASELKLE